MAEKRYIIAHDLGTSGNKATLVDANGTICRSVTRKHEAFNRENGVAIPCFAATSVPWKRNVCSLNVLMGCGLSDARVSRGFWGVIWHPKAGLQCDPLSVLANSTVFREELARKSPISRAPERPHPIDAQ